MKMTTKERELAQGDLFRGPNAERIHGGAETLNPNKTFPAVG